MAILQVTNSLSVDNLSGLMMRTSESFGDLNGETNTNGGSSSNVRPGRHSLPGRVGPPPDENEENGQG